MSVVVNFRGCFFSFLKCVYEYNFVFPFIKSYLLKAVSDETSVTSHPSQCSVLFCFSFLCFSLN